MNVITLPAKSKEVDHDIVSALEEILELAKAGEIVSIAVASVTPDKQTKIVSLGYMSTALLGGIEMVKSDVLHWMREDRDGD